MRLLIGAIMFIFIPGVAFGFYKSISIITNGYPGAITWGEHVGNATQSIWQQGVELYRIGSWKKFLSNKVIIYFALHKMIA
jgi:hypothetical protein